MEIKNPQINSFGSDFLLQENARNRSKTEQRKQLGAEVFKIKGLIELIIKFLDINSYRNFKKVNSIIYKYNTFIPKTIHINKKLDSQSLEIIKKIHNINKIKVYYDIDIRPLKQAIDINLINEIEIENHSNIDYSCLCEFINLKILTFETDKTDLSFFENIQKLEKLTIYINSTPEFDYHNKYYDKDFNILNQLSKLTNLKSLNLTRTVFNNISKLTNLTNLEELNLSKCISKSGYFYLSKLKSLKKLNLSEAELNNIIWIKDLVELTELDLSNNLNISDFSSLSELNKLKKLKIENIYSLSGNKFNINLNFLKNLVNLEYLNINGCNTNTHLPISHLTKLKILKIRDNDLKDITFLETLTNLYWLDISYNRDIMDYFSISKLTKLKKLEIKRDGLDNISFIESLVNLNYLDISENKEIKDFFPLRKLEKLKEINLQRTFSGSDISFINTFDHYVIVTLEQKIINRIKNKQYK